MRYKAAADKREHAGAEINNKYKPDKICMHISKCVAYFIWLYQLIVLSYIMLLWNLFFGREVLIKLIHNSIVSVLRYIR